MFTLRDYQTEDVLAVGKALDGNRAVLGRAATGLGKAVELAELAEFFSRFGRVMIMVDVGKLVRQLAETIKGHTGVRPGIEMGDERAINDGAMIPADKIVVSTVQSQYAGGEGRERFRKFKPDDFSILLLDECETFLAPGARKAVDWYMQNPKLKVFGCSATPFRTDGTPMANLFQAVAFDRDIRWGVDNGWLIRPRQAFVRVSLDFGSLKVRKGADGEVDYSADDIAAMFEDERPLIEVAKGMIAAAGDRRSIVCCPNVNVSKAVAHYLDAERNGCARAIYGELGEQGKDDIFEGHASGQFQFLSSVMMLTKGYDDKNIRAVFNLRKTRSKRLYAQIVGRGTRPLGGTVDGLETPELRKAAIASSAKPDMLMVDLAGVDASVKDIQLVDILHETSNEQVRERAKKIALKEKSSDPDETAKRAESEIAEEKRIEEEKQRQKRKQVEVSAKVEIEYEDDMRVGGGNRSTVPALKDPPSEKMKHLLRAYGLSPQKIEGFSRQQAGVIIARMKQKGKTPDWNLARTAPTPNPAQASRPAGGCTSGQRALLVRRGFTPEQINAMDFNSAIVAIRNAGREVAA